ncbi:MAG TPA: CPBP family intramembrane metalloprotease, partial [Candidatus Ozemobacteraceae bacterium]|nr:CPBP family intramembrane metalloprotease [Candidatus Ozemobacteraceae bacterium]
GMNMMAAALMYFSMFGPLNSVGSEGKAISLLETLPVSPGRIIGLKTLFWSVIAGICFIPTSIFTGLYLRFSPISIFRIILWLLIITPALVWTAVSMSALYARYEGKVLQQRTYLAAKLLAPLVMGLIVSVKDVSLPSLLNAVVFLMLASSLHFKGAETLERRLDPDGLRQPCFKATDAFLTIIILLGIQRFISTVASTAIPPEIQGLWPWLIAYLINIPILAHTCRTYARDRFSAPAAALGWRRCNPVYAVESLVSGLLLGGITLGWLDFLDGKGLQVFAAGADVWSIAQRLLGPQGGMAFVFVGFCMIAPIIEETFFRGFFSQALSGLGWRGTGGIILNGILFALMYPPAYLLPAALLGMTAASLFRRTQSLWPCVLLHSTWCALALMIHAGRM